MKLNVYSIYDSAAKAYATPFFMQNDGLAIRAFQSNVNSKEDNNISKYPDQFTLFKIGEYNDENAEIDPITPTSLGNAVTFKTETKEDDLIKKIDYLTKLFEEK